MPFQRIALASRSNRAVLGTKLGKDGFVPAPLANSSWSGTQRTSRLASREL